MQVSVKIQNDGQAIIPAEVIACLGGYPGSKLVVKTDSKHALLHIEPVAVEPSALYSRDIPPDKSLQDFLNEYEAKYHMSSEEFWQKFKAGEMSCDAEFIDWAGFYEHRRHLVNLDIDPKTATFQRYIPERED